jgi:hypothetical protein
MTLSTDQHWALTLLADSGPGGCPEALLLAHGFTTDLLTDLLRGGLATKHHETMSAGGRTIDVVRLRITDAGRKAREEQGK